MPHCEVGTENGSPIKIPYEYTDFRGELPKIDVPTLVAHGTEDRILPIEATADRLPDLIADVRLVRWRGGPHNIGRTHPDQVNQALLDFLDEPARAIAGSASSRAG